MAYVSITESLPVSISSLYIIYFLQLDFTVLHLPCLEISGSIWFADSVIPQSQGTRLPNTEASQTQCEMVVVFNLSNLQQLCPGNRQSFTIHSHLTMG